MGSGGDDRATRAERQLAAAQQITHIGSWEWDLETNVVAWSDELYRIYGLEPRSRAIDLGVFVSLLHPDDRARVQAEIGEVVERGGRFAYPERVVRPDGTIRHLDTIGEAVVSGGRVVGLIGTCRDVTDERRRDETIRTYADIVDHVQIGLGVFEVGDPDDVATVRLVASNPAADRVARMELAPFLGRPLAEIAPYARGGALERLLTAVARDGRVREAQVERSRHPGDPNRALAMKAFPLPGRRVGVAVEDVTVEATARRVQAAEQRIFEMIASSAPLADILTSIALLIEELSPPTLASILLLDVGGACVRHGAAPSLPEAFNAAVDGSPIGPRAGSCGTAAFRREAVFVEDIETDPLWEPYRDLAARTGLRACWSTPILDSEARVLGTFALYYREPRRATEAELALIARATHVAGIAIERRQLEDQLRALSAHVESVREEERAAISREIHDELGQAITALKFEIAWVQRRVAEGSSAAQSPIVDKLRAMSATTDELIESIRRIATELRPRVLDDLGLSAALDWQAQEFEARTGTPCVVRSNLGDAPLDQDISTVVFRTFQEALTNVARHAGATRVDVEVERTATALRLELTDDGCGITPGIAQSPSSLGLLGMRERARRLGGVARVHPSAAGGTVVILALPLAEDPVRS